jgi:hypothetical protein
MNLRVRERGQVWSPLWSLQVENAFLRATWRQLAHCLHQTTHGATHVALLEDQSISTATSRAIADVVRAARSGAAIAR